MIESINQAGGAGGGGTVDTIQAGTGISVDATNPASPIITNTSPNTDETAKVSSNDTTAGYLNGKLVAGSNVTITENNNGGNETLTIAATVPVTSVNTKTGAVTLTNTDVGAAATSHTHAASDITSGVIATARLGTGTANSTTYLAGDQTYKPISQEITTYTVTTADSENSTNRIRMIAITVPANTWADGERITIELLRHTANMSGGTANSQTWIGGTGITELTENAQGIGTGVTTSVMHRYDFIRTGSGVWYSRVATSNSFQLYYNMGFTIASNTTTFGLPNDNSVDFTTDITLYIDHQWGTASSAIYHRIIYAKAFKTTAGQQ